MMQLPVWLVAGLVDWMMVVVAVFIIVLVHHTSCSYLTEEEEATSPEAKVVKENQ